MTLVRSIFLALVVSFAAGTVVHAADEAPAADGEKKAPKKASKKASKKAEGGEEKKAEEKK
jgi:hypothetical protein